MEQNLNNHQRQNEYDICKIFKVKYFKDTLQSDTPNE